MGDEIFLLTHVSGMTFELAHHPASLALEDALRRLAGVTPQAVRSELAKEGPRLGDFDLADFIFDHPLLLEIPKGNEEEILVSDLKPHEKRLKQADLLLVHTGFSRFRTTVPVRYMMKQPGFSVGAA